MKGHILSSDVPFPLPHEIVEHEYGFQWETG